jgi:hypothetical protein
MELEIYRISGLNEEHVVVHGIAAYGRYQGIAMIQLPYSERKGVQIQGTLLVGVAKPGLIGWLQRKLMA